MESHLLQMRGLKPTKSEFVPLKEVASFTDAWIETQVNILKNICKQSRIFYRCVD